jgi:hypothetical protein
MTFATTGFKPAGNGGGMRILELLCSDTEAEAKKLAETWIERRYEDVAVWEQVGIPKLETTVSWEGRD